ncbi:hypothetical protein [uncultured Clostridium sp.]|uniref:hypothetical protein n=1 Tax=uncultured Clostridium sp. TaxID=59620 RepID=UPI0025F58EAF|nr:hypothetical protein [uncultured Clostridium sp.]
MAKRICPVCDQRMKSAHYCSVCRSFVRHPRIEEGNFYLNERHPSSEGNCEYHNPSFMKENPKKQGIPASGWKGGTGTSAPKYGTGRPAGGRGGSVKYGGQTYGTGQKGYYAGKNSSSPVTSAIIIIFVIMFLIVLLSTIIPVLMFAI